MVFFTLFFNFVSYSQMYFYILPKLLCENMATKQKQYQCSLRAHAHQKLYHHARAIDI